MKILNREFDDKKLKKNLYTAVLVLLVGWFIYRFVMVAIESRMVVFNPVRDANKNGTLVETVVANKKDGVINFPIAITNNRAYVSGNARTKLRVGQKISQGGTVAYVSNSLDYDTGMYIVKTNGANDGVNNVQISCSGYFVPVYAVRDGNVMLEKSGVAESVDVKVTAQDSEFACISGEISNGDIVILSKVSNNQKVNVQK
jgi:hypothetical protein